MGKVDPLGLDYVHADAWGRVVWVIEAKARGLLPRRETSRVIIGKWTSVRVRDGSATRAYRVAKLLPKFGGRSMRLPELRSAARGFWREHPDVSALAGDDQRRIIRTAITKQRRNPRSGNLQPICVELPSSPHLSGFGEGWAVGAYALVSPFMMDEVIDFMCAPMGLGRVTERRDFIRAEGTSCMLLGGAEVTAGVKLGAESGGSATEAAVGLFLDGLRRIGFGTAQAVSGARLQPKIISSPLPVPELERE